MLDLRLIRHDPDRVRRGLAARGDDAAAVDAILGMDRRRRELLVQVEELKAERNRVSKEIAEIKRLGGNGSPLIALMRSKSGDVRTLEQEVREVDDELEAALYAIPNLPADDVPSGLDENYNRMVRSSGSPPELGFSPKPHWILGTSLGILDFDAAAKMSGARFVVFKGPGARLERSLINFYMDENEKAGFIPIQPPAIVTREALIGSAHLPKFEQDQFKLANGDLFLTPTAEAQLTNLHRDEILEAATLPRLYCAFTPCFRAEAGAAGKETRGIIRQHWFDKVELYAVCAPEQGPDLLERLTAQAEHLIKALALPYRITLLCASEMGFAAAKTYDIEVWFPALGKYLEVSSVSLCGDFQARRAAIRYRPAPGAKAEFAHTLNGSGLAVGRPYAAILENYQQPDGSITIPEVLHPYMGGITTIQHRGSEEAIK